MADTTFVSRVTTVATNWLQYVNDIVYGLGYTTSGKGASLVLSKRSAIANAASRTVQQRLDGQSLLASELGIVGDGTTNDTANFANAIVACQLTARNLLIDAGMIVRLESSTTLSGIPITITGEAFATMQQGSQRPAAVLRWHGGAAPMFNVSSSGWRLISLAVENFTTATCVVMGAPAQSMYVEDCSFVVGSGATKFSRAIFASDTNGLGYSVWRRNSFQGGAPAFIDINGNGASNGVTRLEIDGGLFESNSTGSLTIVKLRDVNVTSLVMTNATYNQQLNELCLVDTTTSPRSITVASLVLANNEIDTPTSLAAYRRLKLTNVINAQIDGNYWNGSGTETGMATLVNTIVTSFSGNSGRAIAGPFFGADATSRAVIGVNDFDVSSTQGIINDSATGSGVIPLTYGAVVTILGQYGPGTGHTIFEVSVTNGTGWTLSLAHPGIGAGGFMTRGQIVTVTVRNVSGGALGAITLAGTYFKLAGSAFPVPLNGFSRSVTMVWRGSYFVEISRTTSDVPN